MIQRIFLAILPVVLFFIPTPVYAHAFGAVYRMPIPLHLYLFGAAGALVISFFLIGFFANYSKRGISYPTLDVSNKMLIRFFTSMWLVRGCRLLAVLLLLLCMVCGFLGTQIVTYNFNMTFFWIIFIVGFPYLIFLVGNVWEQVNPWKVVLGWVEEVLDVELNGFIAYPKSFAYLPAFFAYFVLICMEIVFQRTPFGLSAFLLLYTNYAFFMAILFGKKVWEEYIDIFSVLFRLIGSISFVAVEKERIVLRPPFIGAAGLKATDFSLLLIILFMLSSTAIDGFMGTGVWFTLFYDILRPIVLLIGINAYQILSALFIFLSPFAFLGIYYAFLLVLKVVTGSRESLQKLGLYFAFSLIPIAFAYHFAHYFVYLLVQGQDVIALVSDPLGKGWNLFGTTDFRSNPDIVSVNIIWHTQVVAILLGHIAGVYIAHLDALQLFKKKRAAFVSQFPLLVLMVIYTLIGLWILAQPITGGQ
jgi:hypothetical protein